MNKRVYVSICLAMLMLLLAACGGNNGAPAATEEAGNKGAEESEATQAPVEEKPVTISFMHFKSDVTDGVAKIVEQFENENPNIKVEVQPVKYDDYYTLIKTKLAGGDIIDVFTLNSGGQAKLFSDGGYIMDLTGQPFLSSFDESVLKGQATDGKNFVMPINGGPIAVFYNKKIFKDLGLEIPKTYDALLEAANQIKAAGKTPFALGWKDGWTLGMWATRDLPSLTALEEGQTDFFQKLEVGEAKFADNPAVKVTIERAKKLFELGNKDQLGVDYNGAVDLFSKGEVGMMYMGTWPLLDIEKKNPDFYNNDLGYFPYPFSNDPALNKLEFNPDASLAVASNTPHKEAALKFMAFMASKQGGDAWVNNIKSLSYVKGSTTSIAPAMDELQPYFDQGLTYDSQIYFANTTLDWSTQFSQQLQKYFFGKTTPDKIIAEMDDWIAKNHK
ncbi:raffinose/stachyose/melibiose transport system substrate-binding protein [Paenibacillus endophyticus]|uniref:Raffinose/stachyose/melibiose transport system substrate-binding protein n=1 Tax=Paenibacillus endophyticus TaxID=1294268 RepID=A0A7W5G8N9_9BACL|nr:extracellular solute-binding protein [Paenibacillus endophyticus]MBB3150821.1 raffinose/stachyose/melibiose transport system substrate-binding protein [Paenibacillus endophyticus]